MMAALTARRQPESRRSRSSGFIRGFQQARGGVLQGDHAGTTLHRATGGNLSVVKELLGHEAIASTMRYAHTSRDDVRNALRHTYGTGPGALERNSSEINTEEDEKTGT